MKVTLLYYDKNHSALGRAMEIGERIVFGAGDRADLQVSGADIADVHFAIHNDGYAVWVHRLVDAMAPVLLNDQPIEKCEVEDGDTISAGNTKVRVQIRNRDQHRSAADANSSPTGANPAPVFAAPCIVDQELPTGLIRYYDSEHKLLVSIVIEKLAAQLEPLLFANFRAAAASPPATIKSENLLAAAPQEVSVNNSLHVLSLADFASIEQQLPTDDVLATLRGALIETHQSLRTRAAAVLVFTKASKDEVVSAVRFHRGFYCSADALEMFLRQGSRELASKLMAGISAILIARMSDTDWSIYTNPQLLPSIEGFGLNAAI